MTDYDVVRGPGGRPYITRDGQPLDWPEGVSKPLNALPYERVSDLAGQLDTKENLSPYHQAQAVFGVVREKHLAWQFIALLNQHSNPWEQAKKEVKSLLGEARQFGGEARKSGIGSGFHRMTEVRDRQGREEQEIPQMTDWLDCYEEAVGARYTVLDNEVFVVVDDIDDPGSEDDLCSAGSFDKLLLDNETGEVLVGDVKSGAHDASFLMKPTVQVAQYAHGRRYDQKTGERSEIHPAISLTRGLLIHCPMNDPKAAPQCSIYPLDLERGWRLAKMVSEIVPARTMKALKRDRLVHVELKPESASRP